MSDAGDFHDLDIKKAVNQEVGLKSIYEDGYTIKEAADILGYSYEACKKRVQRAKEKIKRKFEQ